MGSVCDRIEKYKPNESLYKMNDEDYKARDITINYTGLNSSFLLEDIYPQTKKYLNINGKTSFLSPSMYYNKQVPPTTSEPFTDELFPANSNSLLYLRQEDLENVTNDEIYMLKSLHWEKPAVLFRNSRYVLYDTIDIEDVQQGSLGNCYFLSVLSTLASSPDIYDKVFIDKEKTSNNCYRIRLIIRGIPKIVCVDDFFPADNKNMFAFAMSGRRELWVQVLEKVWAKINGSYARTIAGLPSEAFGVLSEAPCVTYNHRRYKTEQFWNILKKEKTKGFFIATNTLFMTPEKEKEIGLVSGHAYSVTNLYEFEIPQHEQNKPVQKLRLVQLRNPWSYYEWRGDFCDESEKWNLIKDLKQKVGLINKDDGVFFMDFNDFLKYFPYTYVLKYQKNYFYNYKKLQQQSSYHMSAAKIMLKTKMHIKIGLHLKQERLYSKVENYRLQAARILIAKYDPITRAYTYIGSDFGTNDVLYAETDFRLDEGEYHIFVNIHWPYNTPITYTLSTYSQYQVDILELIREDIPQNYLEQILIDYMNKHTKKETLSSDCITQFSDIDNNTGFYMYLITNNSDRKFIFRANFEYFGAEMIQSEFIKSRDFTKKQNSLMEMTNDLIECPVNPKGKTLLIWRQIKNPYECRISMSKTKLFEYKEGVFDIKELGLYEKIRDVYSNLNTKKLAEDIEYTEVETEEFICVVFRNVTKNKINYMIEVEFSDLVGLSAGENTNTVILLKCEQCKVIKLKKEGIENKYSFKFTYSYGEIKKKK